MEDNQYQKSFRAGPRSYTVYIKNSGEVVFALTTSRIDSWGYEIPSTSLENDSEGHSVSIFRNAMRVLSELVYVYKPPVLWFHIFEWELKRKALYKRLVKSFLATHSDYVSCDENWEDCLYVVKPIVSKKM